jgi:hypothetical protein
MSGGRLCRRLGRGRLRSPPGSSRWLRGGRRRRRRCRLLREWHADTSCRKHRHGQRRNRRLARLLRSRPRDRMRHRESSPLAAPRRLYLAGPKAHSKKKAESKLCVKTASMRRRTERNPCADIDRPDASPDPSQPSARVESRQISHSQLRSGATFRLIKIRAIYATLPLPVRSHSRHCSRKRVAGIILAVAFTAAELITHNAASALNAEPRSQLWDA